MPPALVDDETEVLQAIILADSFNKRFRPLTTRKPRCLLPVCNAPLLDWTFESLALAGVQEIFVICRSHSEQVKSRIAESRWSKPGSGIRIIPIMTAKETFSPGDALRDVYTRGLITNDFVLVMGDLVSNIRIDEVVRVHKERRKTNKDAIMTMVVKESGPDNRTRSKGESSIFVLDATTSECLHYESVFGYPPKRKIQMPREILEGHPEVEIRNDLIDCSIDICSVEVPSLFQDNFDYLDIRRDFVHGILTSDLLMKNIYCYVANEGYAARVKDTRSYAAISKDILSRWTFPLVPDDNHPGGHIYEHLRGNRYIAKDNTVTLARTSKVGNNTMIGSSTRISDDTQIIRSVIGQNCTIGPGTTIADSYFFDGAVIGPKCVIECSIIASGVHVKENSKVPRGCLIGEGVTIGPNARLEPFERLSKKSDPESDYESEDEEDSDLEEVENRQSSIKANLGSDSNALVWPRGPLDEEEEEESVENYKNQRYMRIGDDNASEVSATESDSSSDFESSDDEDSDMGLSNLQSPSSSSTGLPSPTLRAQAAENEFFDIEVRQTLVRAFSEGHSVDNAAVELKTLRMASNVPLTRVRESVIGAIVEEIPITGDVGSQRDEIGKVIRRWGALIDKIGGADAVETLCLLQSHCASSERMPLFVHILAALYQEDIVEEEHVRSWVALPQSKGANLQAGRKAENMKRCRELGVKMLEHLAEQDDDDESEDDEEESG